MERRKKGQKHEHGTESEALRRKLDIVYFRFSDPSSLLPSRRRKIASHNNTNQPENSSSHPFSSPRLAVFASSESRIYFPSFCGRSGRTGGPPALVRCVAVVAAKGQPKKMQMRCTRRFSWWKAFSIFLFHRAVTVGPVRFLTSLILRVENKAINHPTSHLLAIHSWAQLSEGPCCPK